MGEKAYRLWKPYNWDRTRTKSHCLGHLELVDYQKAREICHPEPGIRRLCAKNSESSSLRTPSGNRSHKKDGAARKRTKRSIGGGT
ncbi:hypothetical protein CDAR_441271 [Caerostris darwini]|uniref:Uncharacterized protein n=1 Tax=Caerostris darwini TaxID=1538125 RepID=A0AAV4TNA5_9ARAC|nr:hypothetical protein CDAR_441271 [Caerostris darwini]